MELQPSFRKIILVTGPARSGKSEWAETLALRAGKAVTYVATAHIDPTDLEWQTRIEHHRQRRPPDWQTFDMSTNTSMELAEVLGTAPENHCLLVDSLGTWLANYLEQDEDTWAKTAQHFLESLANTVCDVIFVAEETGWGIVPAYPLGRTFRDRLGYLTRQVGAIASPVYLVTAGHVLNLSALGMPLTNPVSISPSLQPNG
ncbi:bifunctional adenosylcobinamide kinase/adenosylcobinamide-phosphate guanylyltransferase [Leptothermofonsia sichuanensis E412]|nr:bifunctional adenosylcobinamide kinase/adenosylcobinamide-phosphate guanylyltransferase [Leptothermofonsia sichuanensis]QZZ23776.1 bifunctional adenosylcobinamide kinase/adenosylcobinamide-phosphate guanylyltransferase [Leptothermofonsia sichuanensis E412]